MEKLINKYVDKMIKDGLSDFPLVCGLDDEIIWNRTDDTIDVLEEVLEKMSINSLICASPANPYGTILRYLASRYPKSITPKDCETRTFLHQLPVTHCFTANNILKHLLRHKSVIVCQEHELRIITFGTVSPEQAYVTFSSVCFAGFVLFFSLYLKDLKHGKVSEIQQQAYDKVTSELKKPYLETPVLTSGPFLDEETVYRAIIEAGRKVVEYDLVDSYFGNISYLYNHTAYISQTSSSLDDLAGCIDPCPLDNTSCSGITASSELYAHSEIFSRTNARAILHGHPKFAVILSMDCDNLACNNRHQCHIKCDAKRKITDIPIVPGEVGTGPYGLCNTLPNAIINQRGVIVWGHGLFTSATHDFNKAFKNLLHIENMCRHEYFERVNKAN